MNPAADNERERMRRIYCRAWARYLQQEKLEPLEQALVTIIREHPEYQPLLGDVETACQAEYGPGQDQTNPFLHMGMHLALQEQLSTDRPAGIRNLYSSLLSESPDAHALEHRMMECLGQALWQSQRSGNLPDEAAYLDCLRRLAGRGRTGSRG